MSLSQKQFYIRTSLLLAAGILLLLMIVGASLYLTKITRDNFDKIVATREVRSAAADLLMALGDAETGQRGFLLTQNPRYLQPYSASIGEISGGVTRLEQAVARMPGRDFDMNGLRAEVYGKIEELDTTIQLASAGQQQEALAKVEAGTGLALMDRIRERVGAIMEHAAAELRAGVAYQETIGNTLRAVTIFGALAMLSMAVAAAITILRYTREVAEARAEIEAANTALESRVQERTEDLMKANDEIQRFAYIVTHDLRAPLVNIMGFTSELEATFAPVQAYFDTLPADGGDLRTQAEIALREDVPEALGFIRSSTQKMDGLINAILKISREGRRTLKPERLNLEELIEAAAGAVQHQAVENDGEINIDAQADSIVTDRLSIDQIIGNLLDNAIKYRAPDRPLKIDVRARRNPFGQVEIEVEDNGRGIATADHARVFELFRRSGKQDTVGEGIGLAHVRTLARNLGGDISLRSTPGEGSVFTIILPDDLGALKRSLKQ